jgi:hypothetical protein
MIATESQDLFALSQKKHKKKFGEKATKHNYLARFFFLF